MTRNTLAASSSILLAFVFVLSVGAARADEPVTVSIAIKDHQFSPPKCMRLPENRLCLPSRISRLIAAEFESDALHVEKIIPPGGQASVHVRALEPGRYNFFDDFHRATQGFLVVP